MGMGFGGPPPMGFGRHGLGKMKELDEVKVKVSGKMLARIGKYFIPYWKQMILVFLILIATSLLGLVPPVLVQKIIDEALPDKNITLLSILILVSLGSTFIIGLLGVLQSYLNSYISRYIIYDMKNQMYKHLQGMSLRFFSTVKQGEIITRMTSDIDGIQGVFSGTIVNFISNLFIIISTAALLISMNWKLAIAGMIVIPLFIAPTRKVGKVRWKIAMQTQEKIAKQNHIVQETLSISGSILMKIFTKEKEEYNNYKKVNLDSTKLQIKESMAGRWFMMVISIFTSIGPMIIYFFGGYLFIKGEVTVGEIIAFVTLLNRLYGPVNQITNIYVDITRSMALFQRIFDYFDQKQDVTDQPEAKEISSITGNIEFENVCFSYNKSKITLKNISFTAPSGKMIALVGPSGAGKTTITNLIPRLYDYDSGNIKIDGIDIRKFTLNSLRSHIGIVTQDTYLFNGTVKENLLYARSDATDEEIIEACKAAYIHDFIMTLPQGYDTLVGNRGIKLSGGEKQRISIARVILKNPQIIIMDEATSSLDTMSEYYIQKAIKPLLKNRTSIVIAHRLSTIMAADKILVIKDGEIVESGKHEELLQNGGLYKELYDKQFKVKKEPDVEAHVHSKPDMEPVSLKPDMVHDYPKPGMDNVQSENNVKFIK